MLAQKDDAQLLSYIAKSINATPEILASLARRENTAYDLPYSIAGNINTKPETLDYLAFERFPMEDAYSYSRLQEFIAGNTQASPETLDRLVCIGNENIIHYVAQNPKTSPDTLDRICGLPLSDADGVPLEDSQVIPRDSRLVERVIKHPSIRPESLAALASKVDDGLLITIAKQPRTPKETLNLLADHKNIMVVLAVGENKNADSELLAKLAKHEHQGVLSFVAGHPNTPPATLALLAADPQLAQSVAFHLSENPNTPPEILNRLAEYPDFITVFHVADNPKTPAATLETLSKSDDKSLLIKVAKHPNTPPAALDILSKRTEGDILKGVATNRSTPSTTLVRLSEHVREDVVCWVAGNPSTPPKILDTLAAKEDNYFKMWVASNPSTKPDTLAKLATHQWLDVVARVAAHPNTPAKTMESLAASGVNNVLWNLARNKNATPSVLTALASYPQYRIREAAAGNPRTPKKVLASLATDPFKHVRQAVAGNPETPKDVLGALLSDKSIVVAANAQNNPNAKNAQMVLFSRSAAGVEAFYDPKTDTQVYFADRIRTIERAEQVSFHEVTHRNLTLLATTPEGKKELSAIFAASEKELMKALPELLAATGHKSITGLMQDYGYGNTPEGRTAVMGELLPRYAERLAGQPKPDWMKTLTGNVQVWMSKHIGVDLGSAGLESWLGRLPDRIGVSPAVAREAVAELPKSVAYEVFASKKNMPETAAFFRDGKVGVVAPNVIVKPGESEKGAVQRIGFNEAVSELGFRKVLGEKAEPVLNAAWNWMEKSRSLDAKIAFSQVVESKQFRDCTKSEQAEAMLATLAASQESAGTSLFQRAAGAMRDVVRNVLPEMQFSKSDFVYLTARASETSAKNGERNASSKVEATPKVDCWTVPERNPNAGDGWSAPTAPSPDVHPHYHNAAAGADVGRSVEI